MTAQSGPGLGARLERARLEARLTVIQAAERLHVDPRVIEALEAERFEELGASVFVRGHIRHYAELVGEQPAELQALYAGSTHAAQTPDLRQVPQGHSPVESSSALLVPAVMVVSAIAVIGIIWWVAGTLRAASQAQRPGPASSWSAPHAAAAAPTAAPPAAATPAAAPAAGGQSAPEHVALTPIRAEAAADRADSALTLRFGQDSWTEVYDARGRRLFYDVGSANSTRTVSGTPPLRIVLGNPAGVSLQLDGRPVPMPAGAEPNVRIEFEITRGGHAAPHLAAAADTGGAP